MLIGITGKAGAGKDTVADIILSLVGQRAVKYSFAAPLKEMALAIDPLIEKIPEVGRQWRISDLVNYYGWDGAKQHPEVRRFLQRLGTEGVRGTFGPEAWINLMWDWYYDQPEDVLAVIPDCRFPNEAAAIRSYGQGVVIQVVRPDAADLGANAAHPSEQGVEADVVIINDSDIGHLELVVWGFLDSLELL